MGVIRFLIFGLFLLVLTPVHSWSDSLPQSIGSLRLEQIQSGEEAKQEIDRLHGKRISGYQTGYIGSYGGANGKAELWVSEYRSQDEAIKAIEKMAKGIKEGGGGDFWHFKEKRIDGIPVYFVIGSGQTHYFFQKEKKVIWLTIDPPLAREAIREVIGKMR